MVSDVKAAEVHGSAVATQPQQQPEATAPAQQQRNASSTLPEDVATLYLKSSAHFRGGSSGSSSNPPVPPQRRSSVRAKQHARTLTMPADSFASPNAIPPRTSSSAHHAHHRSKSNGVAGDFAAATSSHTARADPEPVSGNTGGVAATATVAAAAPNGHGAPDTANPVLKPVSEGAWIGHGHRPNGSSSDTIRALHEPASLAPMQSTTYALGTPVPPLGTSGDGAADAPRSDPNAATATSSGTTAAISTWTPAKEQIIMGPYSYLHDRPGKNIRAALVSAFNRWLRVPPDRLAIITEVVGMLHTASLLVDDIEDSAELRRGAPVAHRIFGTPQTLNSANYVYFGALRELLRLGNAKFVDIYADELCNLHRGQGLDLYWRDTLTCPTEAEYLEMVGNKTAGLFRLAIKLMQAESESDKDFVPLVNLMGIIFQIRDDYLNLWSPAYAENKGLCEDLTEGKFSFPIIHGVRADPRNTQLLNILRQRPTDPAVKRYATDYLERVGSFAHCRIAVRGLVERARAMVAALDTDAPADGGNAEVKSILNGFLLD